MHTSHPEQISANQTSPSCLIIRPKPRAPSGTRGAGLPFRGGGAVYSHFTTEKDRGQLYGDESGCERTDTGRNEWSPGSVSLRMVALGRARRFMAGTRTRARRRWGGGSVSDNSVCILISARCRYCQSPVSSPAMVVAPFSVQTHRPCLI